MNIENLPIGEKIKLYRKNAKLKQSKLALILGISVSTISGIERGIISPSKKLLDKIADIFGWDGRKPATTLKYHMYTLISLLRAYPISFNRWYAWITVPEDFTKDEIKINAKQCAEYVIKKFHADIVRVFVYFDDDRMAHTNTRECSIAELTYAPNGDWYSNPKDFTKDDYKYVFKDKL